MNKEDQIIELLTEIRDSLKKPAVKRFVPPDILDVSDYCVERKNGIPPQSFIDHYKSKGWKVGKNKMKDWKAAIRTWEQKNEKDKPANKTSLADRATAKRKEWENSQ